MGMMILVETTCESYGGQDHSMTHCPKTGPVEDLEVRVEQPVSVSDVANQGT